MTRLIKVVQKVRKRTSMRSVMEVAKKVVMKKSAKLPVLTLCEMKARPTGR